MGKLPERYQSLLSLCKDSCQKIYGDRLASLAVFGSVARGTYQPDSDIDLLLIVKNLPQSRLARVAEFEPVENMVEERTPEELWQDRSLPLLSPIFKTPEEAEQFSPLFLDMTDDVIILHDPSGFLKSRLQKLIKQLQKLGSQKIQKGTLWYWILKPGLKQGEVVEL